MKKVIEFEDFKVEYDDTQEIRDKVFDRVLEFFVAQEAFAGEVIGQNDDCIINAPDVLIEIADDILKFETDWNE